MSENITISVSKNGVPDPQVTTSGYLLIYMKGEQFLFNGTLELKALTPLLMKILMEKIAK